MDSLKFSNLSINNIKDYIVYFALILPFQKRNINNQQGQSLWKFFAIIKVYACLLTKCNAATFMANITINLKSTSLLNSVANIINIDIYNPVVKTNKCLLIFTKEKNWNWTFFVNFDTEFSKNINNTLIGKGNIISIPGGWRVGCQ